MAAACGFEEDGNQGLVVVAAAVGVVVVSVFELSHGSTLLNPFVVLDPFEAPHGSLDICLESGGNRSSSDSF